MASLQNPQKLVHLDKQDADLHIVEHKSPASILVTHQKERVAVYKVQDLKTSKVWSTKTGHEVVNKAVFDSEKEQYAALLSDTLLWQWKDEHSAIEKGSKVKLDKPAWSLVEGGPFGSFVVYTDGSLAQLKDVDTTTQSVDKGTVQFCLTAFHQSCLYIAIISESGHVYIHKYTSAESSHTINKFSVPEGSVISKSTVCFHKQKSNLQLLIIGSSGTLASRNVQDHISGWKTLPFPSTKSPCIASLGTNFIAVGGLLSNDQVGLGLWDIKYGLLQSFIEFPENNSTCQQLFAIGSRLVIVCGADVYVCRYSIESTTLAAVLGRCLLEDNAASLTQPGSGSDSKLKQILLHLADKQKNIKPSEMNAGLKEVAEILSKTNDQEFISVMSIVCQVVNRCADNDQLWCPSGLLLVIQKCRLPARLCENVVHKALKKEDLLLVVSCARCMENVPEHIIVKCLNFLVKYDINQFSNEDKELPIVHINEDSPIKCPFNGVKATTINVFLKQPYSDVFLQDCMKDMDFAAVMPLLQYLCYVLVSSSLLSTEKGLGISVLQVTEWLNITVDAHFAQLVLSVEARKLLVDLHQTVESQVNLLEELVSLDGILKQIKSKGEVPYRKRTGIYNIHTLHIA